MDIQSASDYGAGAKPKILIYGAPGVGKTVLAAQAPRPCLLLDFDLGAGYVSGSGVVTLKGLSIASNVTMEEFWSLAVNLAEGAEGFKYESLVIDSLTELQNLHRAEVLDDRLSPTRADYQINTEFLRRSLRLLQAAPITVVYTCLEDETADVDGLHQRPALTPALQRYVEAVVEVITYMAMRTVEGENGGTETERVAITRGTDRIRAKDRTGRLPHRVKDPIWDSLFGSLYEEGGE